MAKAKKAAGQTAASAGAQGTFCYMLYFTEYLAINESVHETDDYV